jgi:uncharacterized ferredoxin-like protein
MFKTCQLMNKINESKKITIANKCLLKILDVTVVFRKTFRHAATFCIMEQCVHELID